MTALTISVNAGTAIVSARALGPEGRGLLVLVIATAGMTTLAMSLGTNTAAKYFLQHADHGVRLPDYLGTSWLLCLVQPLVLGPALFLVLSLTTNGSVEWRLLGAGVLMGLFQLASYFLLDALNGIGRLQTSALVSAAGSGLQFVGVLALRFVGQHGASTYVLVLTLGYVAQTAASASAVVPRDGVRFRLRRAAVAALIRRGIPALTLNLGQSVAFRFDRVVIAGLASATSLGVYSVAATVSEMLRFIPATFGQVAFFYVASGSIGQRELRQGRLRLLLAMVAGLVFLGFAAPLIVEVLFGADYRTAVTPLRILLLGEVLIMSFHIDSRLLAARGRTGLAGLSSLAGLVLLLPLDFLLIPAHGLQGAAWASVVGYAAMGITARLLVLHDARPDRRTSTSDRV